MIEERTTDNQVVTIVMDGTTSATAKNLYCYNCGRIVANYHSDVRVIIIGEMREVSRPLDIMCSRCKVIHRIV